jgi:hypothetical protein
MGFRNITKVVAENLNLATRMAVSPTCSRIVVNIFVVEIGWAKVFFYRKTYGNFYLSVLGTLKTKGCKCSALHANAPSADFWDLRVEGVTVAVFASLEFENLATVEVHIAPPTFTRHHFVALRHHLNTWHSMKNQIFWYVIPGSCINCCQVYEEPALSIFKVEENIRRWPQLAGK